MVINLAIVNSTGRQQALVRVLTSLNAQWSPAVQGTGRILEANTALVTTLTGPDNEAFGGALTFVCDELPERPTFSVTVVRATFDGMLPEGLGLQSPGSPFTVEVNQIQDQEGNWNMAANVE